MMKKRLTNYFILILVVNLLTNATVWAFHGEVFAHELDHHHHAAQDFDHLHDNLTDDKDIDVILHLCLHAAGQFQPFYFTYLPLLPAVEGKEILAAFSQTAIPESIRDSLFRPPRTAVS